jgi:hypothetical protein
MLDLKKLLVCDGRPTKEMIDLIVDHNVQQIVDGIINSFSKNYSPNTVVEGIINIENQFQQHRDFNITAYTQHFSEVVDDVNKSIQRYSPFAKSGLNSKEQWDNLVNKKPNLLVPIEFKLSIEITPELKKAILLDQELEQKDIPTARKLKV